MLLTFPILRILRFVKFQMFKFAGIVLSDFRILDFQMFREEK